MLCSTLIAVTEAKVYCQRVGNIAIPTGHKKIIFYLLGAVNLSRVIWSH